MNLKCTLSFYLTICLLFFSQNSCSTPVENDSYEDVVVESGQSLLWKIEGNGLMQPSYLYGTMHIIPKNDFIMGERLSEVAETSDLIVMEVDLDPEAMMELAFMMMIPDGKTIKDILSPDDYSLVQSFMKDSFNLNQMELMTYQSVKPMLLAELLMTNITKSEVMSFELEFAAIASEQNIPVKGLETISEQISYIDAIPLEVQAEMLIESLEKYDETKRDINRLISYYKTQQIDSLYQMIVEDESFKEHEETLLYKRNENWIPVIEELISEQTVFIAVGAGHLPGDRGVINLLMQAGYQVTPIKTDI